ncbi:SoxR reducing system RseC family protein [bacterium AH-315-K03]|nr:SoxR reducing system RseC family protein [bacterium AH-315-K03]
MITETGRVIAVESNCLWVETIRQSTCGGCAVKKGCGHNLLNARGAGRRHQIRVLLNQQSPDDFSIDDDVQISIPEKALVQGALIVYLLPLITLLAGGMLVSLWWQGDVAAFIGSVIGFIVGIGLVKYHAILSRNNIDFQAVILPRHSGQSGLSSSVVVQ